MPRLVILIAVAASLASVDTAFAQQSRPSAAKENAEGDPTGAIRALGAAGYNDHDGRKPPPVTVPRLIQDTPRTRGLPHGTR